ncbi:MAG: hypothetical protein R2795_18825 [Saprospiraceae bacterium]
MQIFLRGMALLWVFSLATAGLMAQEVVQVVTKVVEKTFNYQTGYEVNVEGQKAEIFVETWQKPQISVRLEISAKHPKREVAEADMETVNFVAQRIKNKIYLRNYRFGGDTQTASVLSVTYHITLPEDCPVYVKNYFGAANISNLTNRLRIFGEYSQIDIDNVKGLLDIRSRFGDIVGEKIDGNVTINARRSDVTLYEIAGHYQINAQYGILRLQPTSGLLGMDISAEKSEVHLYGDHPELFAYSLTSTHGSVNTPDNLRLLALENTPEVKRCNSNPSVWRVFLPLPSASPLVMCMWKKHPKGD